MWVVCRDRRVQHARYLPGDAADAGAGGTDAAADASTAAVDMRGPTARVQHMWGVL